MKGKTPWALGCVLRRDIDAGFTAHKVTTENMSILQLNESVQREISLHNCSV